MRFTRSKAKAVPETPVDQIFNGEWEDEQIDKDVSPDTEAVRIKGLGQDIPDAPSDSSEDGDGDGPQPLNNGASPAVFGVYNAEQTRAMPPPAIFGAPRGVDIINSAIMATPVPESSSPARQHIHSSVTGKLRRLSKPDGPIYRSPNLNVNKPKKPAGDSESGSTRPQISLEPQDVSVEQTLEPQVLLDVQPPAAKKRKVASPLRPQTRARVARIRDHHTSTVEENATQISTEPTSNKQNSRQLRSRSRRKPQDASKPREAPKQQDRRSTRPRKAPKDKQGDKSKNITNGQADHVASSRHEIEEGPLDEPDPEVEEHVDQQPESHAIVDNILVARSSGSAGPTLERRNTSSKRRAIQSQSRQPLVTTEVPAEDMEAAEQLYSGDASADEDPVEDRAENSDADSEEMAESSDSDPDSAAMDESMFFGQMSNLNQAFKAVKGLGVKRTGDRRVRCKIPPIKTMKVNEISNGCEEVKKLMQVDNSQEREETMNDSIRKLTAQATSLIEHEGWGTLKVAQDVYLHVLPDLTRVLQSLIDHHRSRADSEKQLSYDQLKVARKIMVAILEVGERVQKGNTNFDPGFPAKTVIKSGIVPNVRKALKSVESRIRAIKQAKVQQGNMESRAASQQHQEEAARNQEADRDALRERQKNWEILHIERRGRAMEGKMFISPGQNQHLKMMPLEAEIENQSEEPTGWEDGHIEVLRKGLQRFTGKNVYSDIFKKYCRSGGPLEKYNVSQIVEMAVWLRETTIRYDHENDVEVEPWVLDIPDPRVLRRVS